MILLTLKNYCSAFLRKADRLISNLLIFFIILVRPLLGPQSICPFVIGCTQFALWQLENQHLYQSLPAIFKRVVRCNPISIWMRRKKQN